ncbi:MFS transporter [candidate division KSB1 bacterium]
MNFFLPAATDKSVKKNLKTLIAVQSTGLILPYVLFQGGVLSLFILQIGGSTVEIGLVFSLFIGLNILRVFIGPYTDYYNRKSLLFYFWLAAAVISTSFLAIIPVYNSYGKTAAILLLFLISVIYRIFLNVGDSAWIPLVSEIIPENIKGRFLSVHRLVWQSVMFLAIILTGIYLGRDPSVNRFFYIFLIAVIFHFIRPLIVKKIEYTPVIKKGKRKNVLKEIIKPLRNRNFILFILYTAFSSSILFVIEPFLVPFLKTGLEIPTSYTLYIASGIHVGSILSLFFWGKISDTYGNRFIFFITNIIIFFLLILTLLIPEYRVSPIISITAAAAISILYGMAFSGFRIGALSRMFSEAPAEERGTYINLWVSIWGLTSFIVPAVTGKCLDSCSGFSRDILFVNINNYKLVFIFSSIFVFLSMYLIKKMKPIEEKGLKQTIFEFINFGTNRY